MANICDTQYRITGEREAVANLWNTINGLDVNQKNVWLSDLAKHYGIDYEQKGISVRGHIYWAEFEENEDVALLSLDTETAWTACNSFFNELNKRLGGKLSVSYREIEWGVTFFAFMTRNAISPKNVVSMQTENHLARYTKKCSTPWLMQ